MYEWAAGNGDEYGENDCAVLFDCLPEEAGHYIMCYYSYKLNCVISVSDPFEVRCTQHLCRIIGRLQSSCPGEDSRDVCSPIFRLQSSSWLVKMISFFIKFQ